MFTVICFERRGYDSKIVANLPTLEEANLISNNFCKESTDSPGFLILESVDSIEIVDDNISFDENESMSEAKKSKMKLSRGEKGVQSLYRPQPKKFMPKTTTAKYDPSKAPKVGSKKSMVGVDLLREQARVEGRKHITESVFTLAQKRLNENEYDEHDEMTMDDEMNSIPPIYNADETTSNDRRRRIMTEEYDMHGDNFDDDNREDYTEDEYMDAEERRMADETRMREQERMEMQERRKFNLRRR